MFRFVVVIVGCCFLLLDCVVVVVVQACTRMKYVLLNASPDSLVYVYVFCFLWKRSKRLWKIEFNNLLKNVFLSCFTVCLNNYLITLPVSYKTHTHTYNHTHTITHTHTHTHNHTHTHTHTHTHIYIYIYIISRYSYLLHTWPI